MEVQLSRVPLVNPEDMTREQRALPKLTLSRKPDAIDGYRLEDFEITGYNPHPHIAAPVAV